MSFKFDNITKCFFFLFFFLADHAWNFYDHYAKDSNMNNDIRIYQSGRGGSGSHKMISDDSGTFKKRAPIQGMDTHTDCLINPTKCEDGFTINFWSHCKNLLIH